MNFSTLTATRSDSLAAGSSYPALTLTVNVASNASGNLTNTATVSGGGEFNTANDTATDTVTIAPPADLTVTMTDSGNFKQGDAADTYTITVTNSGAGATSGTVSLVDTLPTGLTATAMSGTGWTVNLSTLTATRSDALAAGSSYPALTLTVSVAEMRRQASPTRPPFPAAAKPTPPTTRPATRRPSRPSSRPLPAPRLRLPAARSPPASPR